jgi:hypothetical protein
MVHLDPLARLRLRLLGEYQERLSPRLLRLTRRSQVPASPTACGAASMMRVAAAMITRVDPAAAVVVADQHRHRLDILLDEWRDSLAHGARGTRREPEQVLRDITALSTDLADAVRAMRQQIRLSIAQLRAERCRDCGVAQGKLHEPGCLQERCATCGGQSAMCLHQPRRLLPFISWGNVCASCGQLGPGLFDVPARVWRHYIEPAKRGTIICAPCFTEIAELIDDGAYQRQHGAPVALWSREFRRRKGIPPDERSPWDGTTEAEAPTR